MPGARLSSAAKASPARVGRRPPAGRKTGLRAATRHSCALDTEKRAISAIASGRGQCETRLSLVARLTGEPNPSGSPQKVRNGPPSLQEVVIKKKGLGKQIVISSGMRWE